MLTPPPSDVVIGQWNMLASSMAYGEFLSKDDERTFLPWGLRQAKVVDVLAGMFTAGKCDFVVVLENDRPWEILAGLRQTFGDMACVAVVDQSTKWKGNNTAAWIGGNPDASENMKTIWKSQFRPNPVTPTDVELDRLHNVQTADALSKLQKVQFMQNNIQYEGTLKEARDNQLHRFKTQENLDKGNDPTLSPHQTRSASTTSRRNTV